MSNIKGTINKLIIDQSNNIPKPTQGGSMIFYQGYLYLFGGRVDDQDKKNKKKRYYTNKLYKYSIAENIWEELTVPQWVKPVHNHTALVYNGFMIIFGGSGYTGMTSKLILYDINNNHWKRLFPLYNPSARHGHSAILRKSQMCVFGGHRTIFNKNNNQKSSRTFFNDVHLFSCTSLKWIECKIEGQQPRPRSWHSAVATQKGMLIFGGFVMDDETRHEQYFNDCWYLNMHTLKWKEIRLNNNILCRNRATLSFLYPKCFILIGGNSYDSIKKRSRWFNDMWLFKLDTEKGEAECEQIKTNNRRAFSNHMISWNEYDCFIFGGEVRRKRSNDLFKLSIAYK